MLGYFACTAARTRARSSASPYWLTRLNAFLACALSSIGYERSGPANDLDGKALRAFVVSLAISSPSPFAFAHALAWPSSAVSPATCESLESHGLDDGALP